MRNQTSQEPCLATDDNGAPGGIRTPNLLIRSQMLYPLSYGRVAETTGFEPAALRKEGNSLAGSPIRPLWHVSRPPHSLASHSAATKTRTVTPAQLSRLKPALPVATPVYSGA